MHRSRILLSIPALIALLALVVVSPASAKRKRGAPAIEPTAEQKQVHTLRKQIAAEELAIALNLDADQKSALADLVGEVVAERQAHHAERSVKAGDLADILEDYLAEVQKSGEPSSATVDALRELREANRPDPDARRSRHEEVRETLQGILSEEQTESLHSFRPMSAVGPDEERREHRRERREERGERVRDRMHERGFDDEEIAEMAEMKRRRGERKRTRHVVKDVLFSPEFLEVLQR